MIGWITEQRAVCIGVRVNEGERHFGHAERFAFARAGEDHIFHLRTAQGLGRLLAQYPAHCIENVGFAATIRADHDGETLSCHRHLSPVAKGFKAKNLDLLQLEHAHLTLSRTVVSSLSKVNMPTTRYCG